MGVKEHGSHMGNTRPNANTRPSPTWHTPHAPPSPPAPPAPPPTPQAPTSPPTASSIAVTYLKTMLASIRKYAGSRTPNQSTQNHHFGIIRPQLAIMEENTCSEHMRHPNIHAEDAYLRYSSPKLLFGNTLKD